MSVITTTACAGEISQGHAMLLLPLWRGYAMLLRPLFERHLPKRCVIHVSNFSCLRLQQRRQS